MSYSHFNLKTLILDTLYICGYLILSQVKVLLSLLWSLLKGDTENPTIIPKRSAEEANWNSFRNLGKYKVTKHTFFKTDT